MSPDTGIETGKVLEKKKKNKNSIHTMMKKTNDDNTESREMTTIIQKEALEWKKEMKIKRR